MSSSVAELPEPVARVAALMATFPGNWFLCGGWAVDSWLGRESREHGDVDIAVFEDDQGALREHLGDWDLIAHDSTVADDAAEPWDGRRLVLPAHIHGRLRDARRPLPGRLEAPAGAGFGLDIQVDEREGGDWILSRDPRVAVPVGRAVAQSAWGVQASVPEILLFYKATVYTDEPGSQGRSGDETDFVALRPLLSPGQRSWLRGAISLVRPAHPWLPQLR